MKNRLDLIRGCLLGGAVGDALGAPVEFMTISEIMDEYGEEGVRTYVEFTDGSVDIRRLPSCL